jgi:hypothetical protein
VRLEYEQVGDRGDPITRTISAEKIAENIARLWHLTSSIPTVRARLDTMRMAWAHADNQSYTQYIRPGSWQVMPVQPAVSARDSTRSTGKVLGALYTQWEARETESDPVYGAHNAAIERNLQVFFADYASRLSRTVRRRLGELMGYVDQQPEPVAAIRTLMSAAGREAPDTAKLSQFAARLHGTFPHSDSVSCPEFIELLHQYCRF